MTTKVTDTAFLVKLKEITDYIVANKFTYGYLSKADNWESAKKEKKCTCSTMVSLALQEIGVLKPRQIINCNENNMLKYIGHGDYTSDDVKKQFTTYFEVIKVNKKWADFKKSAIPGDTVMWHNHTNVYAGSNSKGDIWYDAGTGSTIDKKAGSLFKDCHRPINNTNKMVIYVCRLKKKYRELNK